MKHKHAELIKAWADGAQIQVKAHKLTWEDRENPLWDADSEYRIKPEPDVRAFRAFREVPINGYSKNYILRFYPSDTGWMCGISNEMMDALEVKK